MGKLYLKYLDGANIYACNNCKAHLSLHDDIISKNFHGRHGKAYLFNRAFVSHSTVCYSCNLRFLKSECIVWAFGREIVNDRASCSM